MGLLTTNTKANLASALGSRSGAQEIENLLLADSVLRHGADPTGGADSSTAIQSALTAASTSGADVIVPAGTYRLNTGITVPVGVNFLCTGLLVYYGTGTAVTVGSSSSLNGYARLRINVKRGTVSDWTDESVVGVKFFNPYDCNIEVVRSQDFTIGAQFAAYLATAYNYGIQLGHLVGNKIALDLHSYSSVGYINENMFLGGRFTYVTGQNTTKSRIGVRFYSESGAYSNFNNNNFYSPTFELGATDASPATAVPVYIYNDAHHNTFFHARTEGNTGTFFVNTVGTNAQLNRYTLGYHESTSLTGNAGWSGNRASDIIENAESMILRPFSVWNSGDIPSNTSQHINSGFEATHTPGISWESSSGGAGAVPEFLHLSNDGEYMTPSGSSPGAVICCDSRLCKRFVAYKRVSNAAPGRFGIRCYDGHPDDGGSVIDSASAQNITTITNPASTTIRVQVNAHGYTTGQRVTIKAVQGTTNANGTWSITVQSANTFDLDASAVHNAPYTTGGTSGIPLVNGINTGTEMFWSATYNGGASGSGSYAPLSDSDTPLFFSLDASVKYFALICKNSTIASFSLATLDPYPISCFPQHGINDGIQRNEAAPDTPTAAGTRAYKTGQFVLNAAKTSAPGIAFGWYCTSGGRPGTWIPLHMNRILTGTKTWDPGNLAAGASTSTTVTVTGAVVGDCAIASHTTSFTAGFLLTAIVSSADTVTVMLANVGGSTTDHASGTLNVQVFK